MPSSIQSNAKSVIGKSLLFQWAMALCLVSAGLVFWSCELTQSQKKEQSASFLSLYDSISTLDSAIIVFKTEDGRIIDTVFLATAGVQKY